MNIKKSILIMVLSIFTYSCNDDDDTLEIIPVETSIISKGNLYGVGKEGIDKQNLIINEQSVWNELVTKMNLINKQLNTTSMIDVDFSKYTVIAVFNDIKPTGGHRIDIRIVSDTKNIIVKTTTIPPTESTTEVITQPYHIVKIAKSDLPIIFK